MRKNGQETEDLIQRFVLLSSKNSPKLALTRPGGEVGGPGAQLSKKMSTLEFLA